MEQMPYSEACSTAEIAAVERRPSNVDITTSDWQQKLPVLAGDGVILRELRLSDAPTLLMMLTIEEVTRFISPPPTSVEGFERFIRWTHEKRAAGQYVCLGVVPDGYDTAIGIFQVQLIDRQAGTAEWGFVIGSPFWGSGLFQKGAELTMRLAFEVLGVGRLEARSAVANVRGNAALRKLGAVREGVLPGSLLRNGVYLDQNVWTILEEEYDLRQAPDGVDVATRRVIPPKVIRH